MSIYSNKMAKERMPGMVKPLVWDINVLLFNSSWKRILVELVGEYAQTMDINQMSKVFYYRAYFNMGLIGSIFEILGMPRESIEIVLGVKRGTQRKGFRPSIKIMRFLPRLSLFALRRFTFSRGLSRFLGAQRDRLALLRLKDIEEFDIESTLRHIEELIDVNREASYFTINAQMIAGFFNFVLDRYSRIVKVDSRGLNIDHEAERTRDIDPNYYLSLLHEEYLRLPQSVNSKIYEMDIPRLYRSLEGTAFGKAFSDFLAKFGHFSDASSDFSRAQWSEKPDLVLGMIKDYKETRPPEGNAEGSSLFKNPSDMITLRLLYSYASKYIEYSKRMSYVQSYGFSFFRETFLHLGRLLKEGGFLRDEHDIFYLTFEELNILCRSGHMPSYRDSIELRKDEMMKYADLVLPEIIYGETSPVPLTKKNVLTRLVGVAASRGHYEGRVKVVKKVEDFNKVEQGDVLVVPYPHANWAPLFTKIKALISESGGILSHCSILAREYKIPAVVAVSDALELKDNMRVVVDGYSGEIIVVEQASVSPG